MNFIKIFQIKRSTTKESRYHPRMGALSTRVTRIQKTLFGIPFKTLHTYRETYHGEVKDIRECQVSFV